MLKPLTLSLALAAAFGISSIALAGGHGCTNCGIASPQGSVVSPQSYASAQCDTCDTCGPKHHFSMPKICLPKISLPKIHLPKPTYTYEWVLKKKMVWGHKSCGGCDTCAPAVYPTSQAAPTPQAAPQAPVKAAGQHAGIYTTPAFKTAGVDSVPPAPEVGGSLLSLTPAR